MLIFLTTPAFLRRHLLGGLLLLFIASSASAQSPTSFEDLAEQAALAREQNDNLRAVELYSRAVQIKPDWAQGWWFLGFLQYSSGSYAPARDALTRFIALTPEPGPATALRGLCEFETGEYEKSLADIRLGISSGAADQPRNQVFFRYREALLLTRLGRFDEALRSYAFLAQQRITDPDLNVAIGLAALRRPLLPKDAGTDRELLNTVGSAVVQYLIGDEQVAEQQFQALFQRFPDVPNEHYVHGFFLFASNPDTALSEFNRELQLNASNENAQVMTAWTLLMQRNAQQALSHARIAVENDSSLATAQLVFGDALTRTGNIKEGLEHLQKASQLDPNDLEIHIALAKAYSRTGDRESAWRERAICLQMTRDGINRIALP